MNDVYVSKVTGTLASDGKLHHCGMVSVCVDVECPTAEKLLYCPGCDIFWGMDENYWADDKTKWTVEIPGSQSNYVEMVGTKDNIISSMMKNINTKDRLLSENHQLIIARSKKIKILEEEQLEYLETHLQAMESAKKTEAELRDTIEAFDRIWAKLRQHYGPNNEVLDELEKKWLEVPIGKKVPPFNNEKIKGLIPNPTVTNSDGKKAPLFEE